MVLKKDKTDGRTELFYERCENAENSRRLPCSRQFQTLVTLNMLRAMLYITASHSEDSTFGTRPRNVS